MKRIDGVRSWVPRLTGLALAAVLTLSGGPAQISLAASPDVSDEQVVVAYQPSDLPVWEDSGSDLEKRKEETSRSQPSIEGTDVAEDSGSDVWWPGSETSTGVTSDDVVVAEDSGSDRVIPGGGNTGPKPFPGPKPAA